MTALLTPPVVRPPRPAVAKSPSALTPSPRLWTRLEFEKLHGQGLFEGHRAFLLHGVIIEEAPTDPPHATGVTLVHQWLGQLGLSGHYPRTQLPLGLGADTEPRPDLALVRGSVRDYALDHPTAAQAVLTVEVADTSVFFDTTTKAELYAEAGVADYWVLDVLNRQLTVFRAPAPLSPGGFAYQSPDTVAPLAAPNSPALVSDLLP